MEDILILNMPKSNFIVWIFQFSPVQSYHYLFTGACYISCLSVCDAFILKDTLPVLRFIKHTSLSLFLCGDSSSKVRVCSLPGAFALLLAPIGASTKPEFLLSYLISLLWSRSPGPGPALSIPGMLMCCLSDGLLLKIEIYGTMRQCSL